jgi:hypothetical protein
MVDGKKPSVSRKCSYRMSYLEADVAIEAKVREFKICLLVT